MNQLHCCFRVCVSIGTNTQCTKSTSEDPQGRCSGRIDSVSRATELTEYQSTFQIILNEWNLSDQQKRNKGKVINLMTAAVCGTGVFPAARAATVGRVSASCVFTCFLAFVLSMYDIESCIARDHDNKCSACQILKALDIIQDVT